MNEIEVIKNTDRSYIYIVPVTGLSLTDSIKNEIKIQRVTFISIKKLSKVRKRFGINKTLSELKKTNHLKSFFNSPEQVVAIIRHSGKPIKNTNIVLRKIIDSLHILSISQLGFSKRRYNSHPTIVIGGTQKTSCLLLNEENTNSLLNEEIIGKINALCLDKNWLNFQKSLFFNPLIKILNDETKVDLKWKNSLFRASKLIGQSICSINLAQAFLFNMIAIEVLLTNQNDKCSNILPKRIESFIGWSDDFETKEHNESIENIYKKRCQYIHDGDDSKIRIADLLLTDDIILNILTNLVLNHKLFPSKDHIIDFSNKILAEQTLGIYKKKSKIRPKTLHIIKQKYNEEDYNNI